MPVLACKSGDNGKTICTENTEYVISIVVGILLGIIVAALNIPVILIAICAVASLLAHYDVPSHPSMFFIYFFILSAAISYTVKGYINWKKNSKASVNIQTKHR